MERTRRTPAALHMASLASTSATRPLVSISPRALVSSSDSAFLAGAGCQNGPSSSCGRAMTTTLDSSPTRRAAAAPASVAAFTAATSPSTKAVTRPLPTFSQPANVTFAAFNMASDASKSATSPLVSIMPNACFIPGVLLFDKLNLLGEVQPAGVGLVGIHVNVEQDVLVHANAHALKRNGGQAGHPQLHFVAMFHAVVSRLGGVHVGVYGGANHAFLQLDHPARPHEERAGRAVDVARKADRHVIQAQADGVGESQLHLRSFADRAQNPEV